MSDLPKVTIGFPVYNGEQYLREALASLQNQTFSDFEVILCDNASTDGTEAICCKFAEVDERFKYSRNDENLGAAKNFNRAFELGKGEYFRWMGHDDRLHPSYLECCVRELDHAPLSVSLVFTGVRYIDKEGKDIGERRSRMIRGLGSDESLAGLSFARLLRLPPSAAPIFVFGLMRASALRKTRLIGSYIASDLIINAELRLVGDFLKIPTALFEQRIHHRERQRAKRSTLRGEAEWFDPNAGAPILSPGFRLCLEYIRGINRLALGIKPSFFAYLAVVGFAAARVMQFLHEVFFRIWSKVSVSTVRHHKSWSLPLRLWMVLKGVINRSPAILRMALGTGDDGSVGRLLFGTLRLGRRVEVGADQLLVEWLENGDENEQLAAALAIQLDVERYDMVYRSIYGDVDGTSLVVTLSEVARASAHRKTELRKILVDLKADPKLGERLE